MYQETGYIVNLISVDINSLAEDTNKNHFRFDPSELTGSARGNQIVFVVAFSMDHPPQVLEIDPRP